MTARKRSLAAALALALVCTSAHAQTWRDTSGTTVIPGVNDRSNATNGPGYCQVTVTTSSATLASLLSSGSGGTCAAPSWSTWAYFRPATSGTAVVRCVADATTPSASLGFPLDGQVDFPMPGGVQGGAPFSTIKCISASGASVTMDIWWMG